MNECSLRGSRFPPIAHGRAQRWGHVQARYVDTHTERSFFFFPLFSPPDECPSLKTNTPQIGRKVEMPWM